jgi:heme-degrading monooxygenase HmoA
MPSGRAGYASGNVVTERVNHRHDSLHRTSTPRGSPYDRPRLARKNETRARRCLRITLDAGALPGLNLQKGFRGSYLLRRAIGNEVEFITIILWDSLDDVRAIAGEDYEHAVIPEDRLPLLTRYDARAAHYELVSTKEPAAR